MSNTITVCGHVGQDPTEKTIGNKTVVEFSLAENIGKDKPAQWYSIKVWKDATKDFVLQYIRKGAKLTAGDDEPR